MMDFRSSLRSTIEVLGKLRKEAAAILPSLDPLRYLVEQRDSLEQVWTGSDRNPEARTAAKVDWESLNKQIVPLYKQLHALDPDVLFFSQALSTLLQCVPIEPHVLGEIRAEIRALEFPPRVLLGGPVSWPAAAQALEIIDQRLNEMEAVLARVGTQSRDTSQGENVSIISLQVFLCHSSGDKEAIRCLYGKLKADGFTPWLDEENILPGQDWDSEIRQAVRSTDVAVICLSASSITKEGYVQKEIKLALDVADEKPAGTIFLIPARLEPCQVPERLKGWHWVDLFDNRGYERLATALRKRHAQLHGAATLSLERDHAAVKPDAVVGPSSPLSTAENVNRTPEEGWPADDGARARQRRQPENARSSLGQTQSKSPSPTKARSAPVGHP